MKMSKEDAMALAKAIMAKHGGGECYDEGGMVEDMPGHMVDEDFLSDEEDTPLSAQGYPSARDDEHEGQHKPVLERVMRKRRNLMK